MQERERAFNERALDCSRAAAAAESGEDSSGTCCKCICVVCACGFAFFERRGIISSFLWKWDKRRVLLFAFSDPLWWVGLLEEQKCCR